MLSVLQACSSTMTPRLVVVSRDTEANLQALSQRAGLVVDALTVRGEERYVLIGPSTERALAGQLIDPNYASLMAGQFVTLPFDSLALVW